MGVRQLIKAHTTAGVRQAYRELWKEILIQRSHRSSLKRLEQFLKGSNVGLNLGCGANTKAGWINVDLWAKEADLHLDLREDFPFRDASVSMIYSEHFFEHLEYPDQAMKFLRESWRVLLPDGIFSVGVPDTEWPVHAYVARDEEYFRFVEALDPKSCDTRMHHLNYHFRQGAEHKYAYDFETLARLLEKVGFVSVARRSFNSDLDSEDRKVGTLYVDARKPEWSYVEGGRCRSLSEQSA